MPPEEVQRLRGLLNNRPRKALGCRTPGEVLQAGQGRAVRQGTRRALARRGGVPERPRGPSRARRAPIRSDPWHLLTTGTLAAHFDLPHGLHSVRRPQHRVDASGRIFNIQ